MIKSRVQTVLFDLDGTLLDTALDLTHAINQLLVRRGKPVVTLESIRPHISEGSQAMLGAAFDINKTHPDYTALRREFFDEYSAHIGEHTQLFPGMKEVLQTFNEQSIPWGVVTNKPIAMAKSLMTAMNLDTNCACLVGAGSTPYIKPDPTPLLYACDQLGKAPKECVYIGDAEADIIAARALEMPSIAAMYGYLPEDAKPEAWQADYYIDKPSDILDWVFKRRSS